ncbi:MAG: hypothetical protein EAZ36_02590, partial [Verrucomicrobia bacterium]
GVAGTEFISVDNTPQEYSNAFRDTVVMRRDPVMQHCRKQSVPIIWDQQTYIGHGMGELWEEQAQYGYNTGIAMALHLPEGRHFVLGVDRDKPLPSDGRELQRLGLVAIGQGEFPTLELTAEGLDLLKSRRSVSLTKVPEFTPRAKRVPIRREGEVGCDEILLGELKKLRKRLADEREVPAYVIFGDKTLREMARRYPIRESEMAGVFGLGEKKREEFGGVFARLIAEFLETNSRQAFDE